MSRLLFLHKKRKQKEQKFRHTKKFRKLFPLKTKRLNLLKKRCRNIKAGATKQQRNSEFPNAHFTEKLRNTDWRIEAHPKFFSKGMTYCFTNCFVIISFS